MVKRNGLPRLQTHALLLTLFASFLLNLFWGVPRIVDQFSSKGTTSATISSIVDGDTIDTNDGQRVRLLGIDAPEYPKACLSKRAKDRLGELILGKEVVLDGNKKTVLAGVSHG